MRLCGSMHLCVCGGSTTPNPLYFQCKKSQWRKIQGFWSPMQRCVSLWVGEEIGKTVSSQSCSPDLAISMSDVVCAVWLVIVTRFVLPFGKGRDKSRQCFTEDSIWLWKSCATWLILCKGHESTTACHIRDGSWARIKKHPHPGRLFKHVLNLRTHLIRAFGHKRVMIILVLPRKSKWHPEDVLLEKI